MRNVVILRHPDLGYRGFLGGVDFYSGKGSTTDQEAVRALLDIGCKLVEPDSPATAAPEPIAPEIKARKEDPETPHARTKNKLRAGK